MQYMQSEYNSTIQQRTNKSKIMPGALKIEINIMINAL